MLLNEPTPHHQARPAAAGAAATTRELPPVEIDGAPTPPRGGDREPAADARSTATDPTVGIELVEGADAVKTVALDVKAVKRAVAEGISMPDATPTVSLSVDAVRKAMAESGIRSGSTESGAEDSDDSATGHEGGADSADLESSGATDAESGGEDDLDAATDAGAGADAADESESVSAAAADSGLAASSGPDSGAGPESDSDLSIAPDSAAAGDSDSVSDSGSTTETATGSTSPEAAAAPDTVELSPEADSGSSTDLVPAPGDDVDSVDVPSASHLVSTDLSTPTSTLVAVPETADDVIATIHAAATAVAAADRRARQAAVVKDDPWTGLDLHRPAVPAPVDHVLDLLAPVLERPLLVVEQPGLPKAADVVALHRSEMELDFVEPPVVAAGAEPPIPPRFGPGLSVLPHIEFPV